MDTLIILISGLVGLMVASLIPALVTKLLMQAVFGRRVYFGMVLLAIILGTILYAVTYIGLTFYTQGGFDLQSLEGLESSVGIGETVLTWIFGFMLQLVLLTFLAPDTDLQMISSWKWAVVLLLQYLVFLLLAAGIAFLLAGSGMAADVSQILMKVE